MKDLTKNDLDEATLQLLAKIEDGGGGYDSNCPNVKMEIRTGKDPRTGFGFIYLNCAGATPQTVVSTPFLNAAYRDRTGIRTLRCFSYQESETVVLKQEFDLGNLPAGDHSINYTVGCYEKTGSGYQMCVQQSSFIVHI